MASSRPGQSLLEKWLENVPCGDIPTNSNNTASVKKEKKDYKDIFASSFSFNDPLQSSTIQFNRPHPPAPTAPVSKPEPEVTIKTEANLIDSSSINGVFGWEIVNDISLPIIFREDERLVPVRLVEAKIIAKFSNILPWTVFSCINIRSYYVTENEATLLNEINNLHCDRYFGYEPFSIKDVVVCLQDVFTLHKFLETSKDIFLMGLAKSQISNLGFVNISGSLIVPYIGKTSPDSTTVRKFVPQSLIQSHVLLVKVEKLEMNEWDASYLRMLLIYSGLEQLQIVAQDTLCLLSDLNWDSCLCALHIEECSPPNTINKPNTHTTTKVTVPKNEYGHPQPSPAHTARQAHQNNVDPSWPLNSTPPNDALRNLHTITRIEIAGISLNAINLKPYSMQQAVFVSDVVSKMFRGVSVLTAHYILEKILQVKLYDANNFHEDTFMREGYRPLQGDKLVLVEVLRKCISQLRHIIMAGIGGMAPSASASYSHRQ
jgi:hypothetical protein